jgi:integrase
MASIFKRKRKVKLPNGKIVVKKSLKYYTRLIDADGIERTLPLFRDKTASQQQAAKLQRDIELEKSGVVDRYKEHRKTPLANHLEDFERSLLAKGGTLKNAKQVKSRVKRVFDECRLVFWNDIQASKVLHTISGLRKYAKRKTGLKDLGEISAQTYNFYLKAIKQFCKWMVQDGRAAESPVQYLQTKNVRVDRRHDRRALETDELRRLLETTEAAPKRFGMTGYERSLLYRFAAYTGLRANEIRNLTVSSYDFDDCTVKVNAAYSKRRREDVLPLRKDLAIELQRFVAGKLPAVQVFKVPEKTADMFKEDLADAKIPYVNDVGLYADFHALRHSTGSLLAASGAHPKVVQSIMRHSDINMTMSRYTHIFSGQESDAVAGLPDLTLPSKESQKAVATGTDNKPIEAVQHGAKELTLKRTPFLTHTAYSGCDQLTTIGSKQETCQGIVGEAKCFSNGELGNESDCLSVDVTKENEMHLRGFEPLTFGFVDRCSIQLSYRCNCFYNKNLRRFKPAANHFS